VPSTRLLALPLLSLFGASATRRLRLRRFNGDAVRRGGAMQRARAPIASRMEHGGITITFVAQVVVAVRPLQVVLPARIRHLSAVYARHAAACAAVNQVLLRRAPHTRSINCLCLTSAIAHCVLPAAFSAAARAARIFSAAPRGCAPSSRTHQQLAWRKGGSVESSASAASASAWRENSTSENISAIGAARAGNSAEIAASMTAAW